MEGMESIGIAQLSVHPVTFFCARVAQDTEQDWCYKRGEVLGIIDNGGSRRSLYA